ncbi:DUF3592 domain-containing protein [Gulbenkiania mobilis]|uniref:DUF3592 domain-containing protein n=1 Tax=Gulbenkiania mobilis TaxID=397457 RepID=UPI0006BC049A|nr:DUF3592 domain-containing protein [Gulbenkiania mobilis]
MMSLRRRTSLLMFAFLASLLVLLYFLLKPGPEMATWPTAEGRILASRLQVVSPPHAPDQISWQARVQYRYTVQGHSYRQDRIFAVDSSLPGDKTSAEDIVRRYPAGKKVVVYYNPHNPRAAVLVRGPSDDVRLARFILGALTVLFGYSLWRQLRHAYPLRRNPA